MNRGGWQSIPVRGRLLLNDEECPVISAAIAYELNSIPRATFSVGIGRNAKDLTPAAVHRFADQVNADVVVKFYLDVSGGYGTDTSELPQDEFLLFEGYLTNVGMERSGQGGSFRASLEAKHWLLDMDYSSALSDSSHPSNPSHFIHPASYLLGAGGSESWTPFTKQGLITATTLATDFWGEGLLPWLQELTEVDRINTMELGGLVAGGGSNDTAAKALKRFTLADGNYVPLRLDMKGADAASVAAAIWNDVQMETYESFANTTLWGKLVGAFAPTYMFAVVPRVEDALVVPYVPGLRTSWKHEILPKDYDPYWATSELQRLLKGVGVFAGLKFRTGANLREPGGPYGIGGWFPIDQEINSRGMVMLRAGPRWLTDVIATDRYSEFSSGAGVRPISNVTHPGTGTDTPIPDPATLKQQSRRIFDAYAEALYVYEILRLRQVGLRGKLRFDICPGSTVRTTLSGDTFIPDDKLSFPFLGDVLRVTHLIDVEGRNASTSFDIGHCRTVAESQKPGYSVDRHPLWMDAWSGAGLIKDYD